MKLYEWLDIVRIKWIDWASSSSSSSLEFSSLGSDSGSSMGTLLTRVKTKMTLGFSISGTSQEENTLSGGCKLSQLIESVDGSLGSNNSLSSSFSESQGSDLKSFRDVKESDIVGNCSNNSDDLRVELGLSFGDCSLIVGEMSGDSWDGDGISGKSRLVESLVYNLIEFSISPSSEEGIELH